MAEKQTAAVGSPNEANFEPATEWITEDALDTLMVYLPGFKKETLRIQITSTGKLRISGERQGTTGVKSQFQKEYPIPQNCNANKISANFVEGIINVKLPKTKPPSPAPDVKAQEKPESTTETTPPPAAKLPKPTTTTTTDQQLKDKNKIAQKQQGPSIQPNRVPTTKDQTGDASIAQQKPSSQKEKQPSEEVGSKKYEESKDLDSKETRSAGADNARSNVVNEIKAMEKEKNKDGRGKTVGEGGEAGGITNGKPRSEGLVAVVKKPRKLLNLVVGLFLVVVFTLYLKDAIFKSFKGESKRSAEL